MLFFQRQKKREEECVEMSELANCPEFLKVGLTDLINQIYFKEGKFSTVRNEDRKNVLK